MTSSTLQHAGLIKIGSTTDLPENRARQLTASTSSPTPFHVLYHRFVSDCTLIESVMHERFDHCRVNEGREFFAVPVSEAVKALDELAGREDEETAILPDLSFSELFATFPDDGSARELTEHEKALCRALESKTKVSVFTGRE